MIRYALICERKHEFESWFQDSTTYDKQVKRGLVTCPQCGSAKSSGAGRHSPRNRPAAGVVSDNASAARTWAAYVYVVRSFLGKVSCSGYTIPVQ